MNFLKALLDVGAVETVSPDAPVQVPDGKVRIHFFSGTFDNEDSLLDYCYDQPDNDTSEELNRELDGAYVDTTFVDTAFGKSIPEALRSFLSGEEAARVQMLVDDDNALVIISEHAFGGLPYSLEDTEHLRYLGERIVDAP